MLLLFFCVSCVLCAFVSRYKCNDTRLHTSRATRTTMQSRLTPEKKIKINKLFFWHGSIRTMNAIDHLYLKKKKKPHLFCFHLCSVHTLHLLIQLFGPPCVLSPPPPVHQSLTSIFLILPILAHGCPPFGSTNANTGKRHHFFSDNVRCSHLTRRRCVDTRTTK